MAQTIAEISQPSGAGGKVWGESEAYWVQTGVLFLAVVVAVVALIVAKRTERKKAAAAVLFASRKDSELISAVRKIAALHQSDNSMAMWAKKEKSGSEETKSIRYALNHYEYVSVGISHGIYDEEIFKSSNYTTVVRLYDRTKPFIDEIRKSHLTAWQEFEGLACKWKNAPLKHKPVIAVPA